MRRNLLFIGEEDVWHPQLFPQIVFSDDGTCPVRRHFSEDQTRVDIAQLKKRLHFELQIVCLKVLQKINIIPSVDFDRLELSVFISS